MTRPEQEVFFYTGIYIHISIEEIHPSRIYSVRNIIRCQSSRVGDRPQQYVRLHSLQTNNIVNSDDDDGAQADMNVVLPSFRFLIFILWSFPPDSSASFVPFFPSSSSPVQADIYFLSCLISPIGCYYGKVPSHLMAVNVTSFSFTFFTQFLQIQKSIYIGYLCRYKVLLGTSKHKKLHVLLHSCHEYLRKDSYKEIEKRTFNFFVSRRIEGKQRIPHEHILW